jgi:thiosulfate dehydrogenase
VVHEIAPHCHNDDFYYFILRGIVGNLLPFALCFLFGIARLSADDAIRFQLVDPETAPPTIHAQVMRGYNLMRYTHKLIPEFAGDAVACTNCHFAAGNTFGGENGGISLVGVFQKYPISLPDGKPYTLAERINSCFEKSLNGKPLPIDSADMLSFLAYLEWISSPIAAHPQPAPWLGLNRKMRVDHAMNPAAGRLLYDSRCALCHGDDGEGQKRSEDLSYPPLWGPRAFNTAAGMNQLPILASFIHLNMPYEDPSLTLEQALDIAAFIISQPRPSPRG